jgi:hypothetical protein
LSAKRQIGNNYIIQFKAPTISVIGQLPPMKNPDGTFNLQLAFRIDSQSSANSLLVSIMKEDVVRGNFRVLRRESGVTMGSGGEKNGYLWQKIQAPTAGEYVVIATVRSEDVKPRS